MNAAKRIAKSSHDQGRLDTEDIDRKRKLLRTENAHERKLYLKSFQFVTFLVRKNTHQHIQKAVYVVQKRTVKQ